MGTLDVCDHNELTDNFYTSEQIFIKEYYDERLDKQTKKVRLRIRVCSNCRVLVLNNEIEVK